MIELATTTLAGTSGTTRLDTIEDACIAPGSLDLITSRLALHYVSDLDRVIGAAAMGLVTAGRLIFSVVHPVITSHENQVTEPRSTWTVDGYFARGPREHAWLGSTVTWYHRTVEDYVRAVTKAGLTVTSLRECEPDPKRFPEQDDELARRQRVPLFLLIAAQVV